VSITLYELLVISAVGALAALAVNKSVAAYHDGLRTSLRDLWTGDTTRAKLAKYSLTISTGFVVAYALPLSLASGIVVIHLVFLGTDYLGIRIRQPVLAALAGAAYAAAASLVVSAFFQAAGHLPGFLPSTALLWAPVLATIPIMPAMAAGHQHGFRWGAIATAVTLVLWAGSAGVLRALGHAPASCLRFGGLIAFAAMSVAIIVAAWRQPGTPSNELDFFTDRIARIRKGWPYLVPLGALIAVAAAGGSFAGEPAQLAAVADGQWGLAGGAALLTAASYFPVQGMTGLVSGIWSPTGYADWLLAGGYLVHNPVLAAPVGAALVVIELLTLKQVARVLTGRPGITSLGHAIRDAMDVVPQFSILAGAVLAATSIAGPIGACVVIGGYALNELKGRPVIPLAAPVIAFLVVGLGAGVARSAGWIG
jgi:hypothetical protein